MSSVRGPCCRERFYFGLATFQVFLFLPNKKGNKTDIENCVGFIKRKPSGLSKVNKKFNIFLHKSAITKHPMRKLFPHIVNHTCIQNEAKLKKNNFGLTFFNLDPNHYHHRHCHRYFSL